MYKCCEVRKLLRLLALDGIIFTLIAGFFMLGRLLLTYAEHSGTSDEVKLPVIMYHSVCDRQPAEYSVTPQQAESDLKWLRDNGYTAVSADEVIRFTRQKGTLPEKPVMITLDDGSYNNYSEFLPLLEKYDMRAVVSVVGSYADNDAVNDPHEPAYSYLTWEDMKLLTASGRVELGNHTYAMHSLSGGRTGCSKMPGETAEDYRGVLREDIWDMQTETALMTGTTPVVFAYPFGAVSRESIPVIREAGILMTLTCREQVNTITHDPDCLYGIGRFNRSGLYSTASFMDNVFSYEKQ